MNSIVGNHHHNHTTDTCVPLMGEERIEMADPKANETECKEVRVTWGGGYCVFSTLWGQLLAASRPWCPPLSPFVGKPCNAKTGSPGALDIRSLHYDFGT